MLSFFESKVSKPYGKFILEIVTGILITQSCNATEISKNLRENIKLKDKFCNENCVNPSEKMLTKGRTFFTNNLYFFSEDFIFILHILN
jgi:hypothetical protein